MEQEHAARRILVADDEEMVATSLARMIHRRFGCPVDTVPDGDAVIHALESQSYDVLITDMAMPGIHGAELVAAVVKLRPTLDVMVVTAFPREFPYMEVIDAGATDFIIKPCAQEELAAKLLRILKERTLREALAEEKRRILEDMEALRQARAAQAYAEEKYRSLFEFSMNGMLLLEPNGLSVVDVNQTFCELSGRTRDEVLTRPIFELFGPEHGERLKEGLGAFVEARRGTLADITLQHPSGRTAILDVSVVFLEIGRESIGLVTLKDVTEQRELQRQLAERALSDTLTGLYNQGAFHTKLRGAIAWARRHKQPLSLIFLDVDNFKTCNDTYGHQAGDELLHRVGDVIRETIRLGSDEGFRYGGDEFAAVLMGADATVAEKVGERMRKRFDGGERFGTSFSVGVAQYEDGMDGESFVRLADRALYCAKASGKDVTCVA